MSIRRYHTFSAIKLQKRNYADRLTSRKLFEGSVICDDISCADLLQITNLYELFDQYFSDNSEIKIVHDFMGPHDTSLESHSYRTSQVAFEEFSQLDSSFTSTLSSKELDISGLFHDVGKLCISKEILLKKEALSKEEVHIIKMHPYFSYLILKDIFCVNQSVLNIALFHHEKWDGTGYPYGLKNKEIPIEARIFSLIDVWDALISERPYRNAIPHSDALKMMMGSSFKGHFDPVLLEKFVSSKQHLLKRENVLHCVNC